jgi:hypothetical protein
MTFISLENGKNAVPHTVQLRTFVSSSVTILLMPKKERETDAMLLAAAAAVVFVAHDGASEEGTREREKEQSERFN